jgi:hypothetical protein
LRLEKNSGNTEDGNPFVKMSANYGTWRTCLVRVVGGGENGGHRGDHELLLLDGGEVALQGVCSGLLLLPHESGGGDGLGGSKGQSGLRPHISGR